MVSLVFMYAISEKPTKKKGEKPLFLHSRVTIFETLYCRNFSLGVKRINFVLPVEFTAHSRHRFVNYYCYFDTNFVLFNENVEVDERTGPKFENPFNLMNN